MARRASFRKKNGKQTNAAAKADLMDDDGSAMAMGIGM